MAKSKLTYDSVYWGHLIQIANRVPHECFQCQRKRSAAGVNPETGKRIPAVIVRLALKDKEKPANDWRNVEMFCTQCRRTKGDDGANLHRIPKVTAKQLRDLILPLFTEHP